MWKRDLDTLKQGEENFIEESEPNAISKIHSLDYAIRKRVGASFTHIEQPQSPSRALLKATEYSEKDLISFYSMRNKLGYPIILYKYLNDTLHKQSKEHAVVIRLKDDEIKGIEDMKEYYDTTSFDPYALVTFFDVELSLANEVQVDKKDSVVLRGLRMGGITQLGFETIPFPELGIKILKKIDTIGTRTVVNLCSTVVLVNRTRFDITVDIANRHRERSITIPRYNEHFLPIDFVNFRGTLYATDPNDTTSPITLGSLDFDTRMDLKEKPLTRQLKGKGTCVLVTMQKSIENEELTTIIVQPAYTATNFLPFRAVLGMGHQQVNAPFELFPRETIEVYSFSQEEELEVCVSIAEIGSTRNLRLVNKRLEVEDVLIENRRGGASFVSIKLSKGFGALTKIYIYSKVILINNSPFSLQFHYSRGMFENKVKTFLGNEAHDTQNQSYYCALGLLPDEDDFTRTTTYQEQSLVLSDDFKIKSLGVKVVSLKNRGMSEKKKEAWGVNYSKQIDLGMQVVLEDNLEFDVDEKEVLYTKYVTFTPRYVVVNNSPHDLQICQYEEPAATTMIIEPMSRKPLFWPKCDRK